MRSRYSSFGFTLGDDGSGGDLPVVVQADAHGPAMLDTHPGDGCVRLDLDAQAPGLCSHRLRDGSHTADRMSPYAALPVDLAEGMMEQDVR